MSDASDHGDYQIVHTTGEMLAIAPTARQIRAKIRRVQKSAKYFTILDRQGGQVTRLQLEALCLAEERGEV